MNESSEIVVVPFPTSKRFVDLTGRKFERWTVLSYAGKRGRHTHWNCLCACGSTESVYSGNLTRGLTLSCGCLCKERTGDANRTHGLTGIPEYKTWAGMKRRCLNKRDVNYPNYGGRGITICEDWLKSFEAFFRDMGPKPSSDHSIERRSNDVGYGPGNCFWATVGEQANNKRTNHKITYCGFTGTLAQVSREFGITQNIIRRWAIRNGQ